jgi:hypothetical protein
MALQSSKVAAGIKILADHFNALWTDLVVNHDHSSGMGGTVGHADLSDGAIGGTTYEHSEIDTHIDAGQGVHDLDAAAYVAGSLDAQLVINHGSFNPGAGSTGTVNFTAFTGSAPTVHLTCYHATETTVGEMVAIVTAVDLDSFDWRVSSSPQPKPTTVYWLAVGTK